MASTLSSEQHLDYESIGDDIRNLNFAYLFTIREMGKRDPAETALRFGVDASIIDALVNSTVTQIRSLADPVVLQVRLRSSSSLRSMLKAEENDDHEPLFNSVALISESMTNV